MTRARLIPWAVASVAFAGGCGSPDVGEESADPAELGSVGTEDQASTSTADSDAYAPIRELAEMDPRQPVPLQPMMAWHQKQNMMEHLVAIRRITDGLAREDWDEVATASRLIEASPQMERMCHHMGQGADGFTEMALEFHRRAAGIGEAAERQDGASALGATAHTLEACTSCHAAFRQEVVDSATWQTRTGSEHQPMHGTP
ncbi:MAG: hypothetical protein AAGF12_34785 [Myxococcota bacterium]